MEKDPDRFNERESQALEACVDKKPKPPVTGARRELARKLASMSFEDARRPERVEREGWKLYVYDRVGRHFEFSTKSIKSTKEVMCKLQDEIANRRHDGLMELAHWLAKELGADLERTDGDESALEHAVEEPSEDA